MNLIIRLMVNTAALLIAAMIVNIGGGCPPAPEAGSACPVTITDPTSAILAALVYGLVNALIRPLVSCLTCLVQMITLGLFTFVINALMLLLASWISGVLGIGFQVNGFGAAFFTALAMSIVSMLLTRLVR